MLTIKQFIAFLKTKFPYVKFYNSTMDKSEKCVGIYKRSVSPVVPLGGVENGSYNILPISILVHWTEDASQCEDMANNIYNELRSIIKEATPDGTVISYIHLLDSHPQSAGRDDKNIVENVIRANIIYERGVD